MSAIPASSAGSPAESTGSTDHSTEEISAYIQSLLEDGADVLTADTLQKLIDFLTQEINDNPDLKSDKALTNTLKELKALSAQWSKLGTVTSLEDLEAELNLRGQMLDLLGGLVPAGSTALETAQGELYELKDDLKYLSDYLTDRDSLGGSQTTYTLAQTALEKLKSLENLGLSDQMLSSLGLGYEGDGDPSSLYSRLSSALGAYGEALLTDPIAAEKTIKSTVAGIKRDYASSHVDDADALSRIQGGIAAEELAAIDPTDANALSDFLNSLLNGIDFTKSGLEAFSDQCQALLDALPKTKDFEIVRGTLVDLKAATDLALNGLKNGKDKFKLFNQFRESFGNAKVAFYASWEAIYNELGNADDAARMQGLKDEATENRNKALESLGKMQDQKVDLLRSVARF